MRHVFRRIALGLSLLSSLGEVVALSLPTPPRAAPINDARPLAVGQVLHVRVDAGTVTVRPGEAGTVSAEAALAPGQRLTWRATGDRLALVVVDAGRIAPRPVALTLAAPADADLVLRLGDASLRLTGFEGGRLRVEGGRGDVAIDAAMRQIRVDTLAGGIDIRARAGEVSTRSVAGEQRISASGAMRLDAQSASGSLDVRLGAGGTIRVASTSGPITLDTGATAGLEARLDSLSGALELRLPVGEALAVEVAQATGDAEFPETFAVTSDGVLRAGEGGGTVQVNSFSGNLKVVVTDRGAAAAAEAPSPR